MTTLPQDVAVVRSALEALGGDEQSIDAVRDWVKLHYPDVYSYRRTGTVLRGYSINMPLAQERHRDFKPAFVKRTRPGHYTLI